MEEAREVTVKYDSVLGPATETFRYIGDTVLGSSGTVKLDTEKCDKILHDEYQNLIDQGRQLTKGQLRTLRLRTR